MPYEDLARWASVRESQYLDNILDCTLNGLQMQSAFGGLSATSYGTQYNSRKQATRAYVLKFHLFFIFTFYCHPSYMSLESQFSFPGKP